MDKNTTIAFILIGAILIFWLYMNSQQPPPPPKPIQPDSTLVKKDTAALVSRDSVKEQVTQKDSLQLGKFFNVPEGKGRIITVENDLVKMEFSTLGGNIRKYFLKKHNNWYSSESEEDEDVYNTKVQLISYNNGNAFDLAFVTTDGKAINTSGLLFSTNLIKPDIKVSEKDSIKITFTLKGDNNSEIRKHYTFYGNKYHLKSEVELIKTNNVISNNAYDIVWSSGIRFVEQNSVDEANYSNASVYYGGEQVIVDASDPDENVEEDFNGRVDWMGIRNKYFAAIIAPENPEAVEGAYIKGYRKNLANSGVKEYYDSRLTIPYKGTDYQKNVFILYVGPVDYDLLKAYGKNLDAIVDFGSFFGLKFIIRPISEFILLPLFTFLHSFIPNYGIVIIVFSLIIKVALYPLTKQSYHSMKKMQLLQPKMNEIREKYKEDPPKMNKEMMKLYSTYGVNPAGGCFPLLLQMPIFIALWGLFQVAIELRQQPFMLWINDLSRPDVIYALPFKIPLFGVDKVSGLALLMGITTFVQQKMSVKDPKQQMLVYIMPVMLTILFMSFPSGLNLYYFMFNVFSIAQQYYINHKSDGMVLEPVKNPKKQKGFMAKLMDAAEQNKKAQQQQIRKKH